MGDWISVKDRMPNANEAVFMAVVLKYGTRRRTLGMWRVCSESGSGGWAFDYPWNLEPTVTHWQPLPDLPKEAA